MDTLSPILQGSHILAFLDIQKLLLKNVDIELVLNLDIQHEIMRIAVSVVSLT